MMPTEVGGSLGNKAVARVASTAGSPGRWAELKAEADLPDLHVDIVEVRPG